MYFGAKLLDLSDTHRFKRFLSSWSVITTKLPGDSQTTSLEDLLETTFFSKRKHFPRQYPIPNSTSGEEPPSFQGLLGNSGKREGANTQDLEAH